MLIDNSIHINSFGNIKINYNYYNDSPKKEKIISIIMNKYQCNNITLSPKPKTRIDAFMVKER